MSSFLEQLHGRHEVTCTFDSFGWKEDGSFLAGQMLITQDGEIKKNKTVQQTIKIAKHFKMAGSLDKWLELTTVFNNDDNLVQGFCFLVGAGSPFLKNTGFSGTVLNMCGESGTGKTAIQRLVNSLYGDPNKLMINGSRDSHAAIIRRFGIHNSIASCIDDVGLKYGKTISKLLTHSTQGADRRTLNNLRDEQEAKEWNLAVLMSSENSIFPKLPPTRTRTEAASLRALEIKINPSKFFDDAEKAAWFNQTMIENHGHVGHLIVQFAIKNQSKIDELFAEIPKVFKKNSIYFTAAERFRAVSFHISYVAARVIESIGLMKFDYLQCLMSAYSQVVLARNRVPEKQQNDGFSLVSDFLNANSDKILVVELDRYERPVVTREPKDDYIMARLETTRGHRGKVLRSRLYVSTDELRVYLTRRSCSIKNIAIDLDKGKALLIERCTVYLGRGTKFDTPFTRAMVLDMLHPKLLSAMNKEVVEMLNLDENFDPKSFGKEVVAAFR